MTSFSAGPKRLEQSRPGCASEYAVDLGSHDEVVLMQSMDLLGLQGDGHIAQPKLIFG
jgi:hypothetical protein